MTSQIEFSNSDFLKIFNFPSWLLGKFFIVYSLDLLTQKIFLWLIPFFDLKFILGRSLEIFPYVTFTFSHKIFDQSNKNTASRNLNRVFKGTLIQI